MVYRKKMRDRKVQASRYTVNYVTTDCEEKNYVYKTKPKWRDAVSFIFMFFFFFFFLLLFFITYTEFVRTVVVTAEAIAICSVRDTVLIRVTAPCVRDHELREYPR